MFAGLSVEPSWLWVCEGEDAGGAVIKGWWIPSCRVERLRSRRRPYESETLYILVSVAVEFEYEYASV